MAETNKGHRPLLRFTALALLTPNFSKKSSSGMADPTEQGPTPPPFTPEQLAWLQGKFGQQPANPEPTGPNPAATASNPGASGAALPDGGELIRYEY